MKQHDVIVIGGGPAGYVAAIRAAQLGLDTACIERETVCGGTCLRIGCIPSKALLESSWRYIEAQHELKTHGVKTGAVELELNVMMERKNTIVESLTKGITGLFKKNKVTRYEGHGRLDGPGKVVIEGKDAEELKAKHIILATGSVSSALPGIEFDDKGRVGTSTEALDYPEPPEHLVVIGAGYIGLEMGSVWRRLGSRVKVLEYLPRILPGMDAELAREAMKEFERQGIEFQIGAEVLGARVDGKQCVVEVKDEEPIRCDRVLVAVGRTPYTEGLGLDTLGIQTDKRGRVVVDEHYTTSAADVYAIGDIIVFQDGYAPPMLAHKSEDEGIACVERIVTGYGHVNYDAIPAVCYTHPEIGSVGKTEDALRDAGIDYRKGTFPFQANGRARSMGETQGKVKVLSDAKTDRILGVHIIGPRAGDLIAEAAVAMEFGASSEDLARCCHAHPTLAECIKEAALATDGRAIHI